MGRGGGMGATDSGLLLSNEQKPKGEGKEATSKEARDSSQGCAGEEYGLGRGECAARHRGALLHSRAHKF